MITRLYTIFDKLAGETGPIWQAKNDRVAHRQFMSQIQKSDYGKHTVDFELCCVGEYDNETRETQPMLFQVDFHCEMSGGISEPPPDDEEVLNK